MSFNLVDLIKDQVSGQVLGQISNAVGESSDKTQSVVEGAIPALLGGFMDKASSSEGAGALFDAVSKQDDSILDNLSGMIGSGNKSSLIESGGSALGSLFGGSGASGLVNAVSGSSGMSSGGTSTILSMLAPMVMSTIKRFMSGGGNNDANGLATMLASQKDNIAGAMPSGLADQLGSSGFMSNVGNLFGSGAGVAGAAAAGVAGLAGSASGALSGAADKVGDMAGGAVDGVTGAIGGVTDGVTGAVSGAAGKVGDMAGGAVDGVSGAVSGAAGKVGDMAGGAVDGVSGAVSGAAGKVGDMAGGAVDGVSGAVSGAAGKVGDMAGGAVDGVSGAVSGAAGKVGDMAGGAVDGVSGAVSGAAGKVGDMAGGAVDGVSGAVSGAAGKVGDMAGGAVDGVSGAVSGAAGKVGDVAGNVADGASNIAGSAAGAVGGAAGSIGNAAGETASTGMSWIKKLLIPLVLAVLAFFGWKQFGGSAPDTSGVTGAASSAMDKVSGMAGGDMTANITSMFGSATESLEGITDVESAKAAVPALTDFSGKIDGVASMADKLPDAAKPILAGALEKIMPMLDKVMAIPGVGAVLGGVIEPLKEKLTGLAG